MKKATTTNKKENTMKNQNNTPAAVNPATTEPAENLPAKKDDLCLSEWFDRNLGKLDCEESAWLLAQTLTSGQSEELKKHVFSDGEKMYCSNGKCLLVMSLSETMPAGVYDTVLAGRGKDKRRTFLPMNCENFVDKMKELEANAEKEKDITEPEKFDFSINKSLSAETFALLYYLAINGDNCVLADEALNIVFASCQELTCHIKNTYVVFENSLMTLVFMAMRTTNTEAIEKSRILGSIRRFSKALPEAVKAEPVEEVKPEAVKEESKIKKIKEKYTKKSK